MAGVIRSTTVLTTDTPASSHAANAASPSAAASRSTERSTAPLSGTLSQGTRVIGAADARNRARNPATSREIAESRPGGGTR